VLKVYEAKHAIDDATATVTGLAPGTGFHLALSNVVHKDNRIPPRGFRRTAYVAVGAAPVGATFADGQHWDDTGFPVPPGAVTAEVILYFETTTREYIEFLRDADPDGAGGAGARAFAQWSAHARPVVVDARRLALDPVAGTTTSTSTTSTTLPRCSDGGGCDDGDPCTGGDRCEAGECVGRVADVAGVECRLERLVTAPCAGETLPSKLDQRIRKKVQKTVRLLEGAVKAASKKRQGKAEKLRARAAQQLAAISAQAARAAGAPKPAKRISPACRATIDGIVSGGRLVVEGLALDALAQ
jgi:hypothetical protein